MIDISKYVENIAKSIEKPLIILDIETTGIEVATAEIVSLAMVKIYPDGRSEEKYYKFKTKNPIPKAASDVHGITDDMVKDCPPFKKLAKEVAEFIKGSDIAGFNQKSYDIPIIDRHLSNCGIKNIFAKSMAMDAYQIYRKHSTRKLADSYLFYTKEELSGAHDALVDVYATAAIIDGQLQREGLKIQEIVEKYEKSDNTTKEPLIVCSSDGTQIINFSKHKGTPINQLETGFLQWIMGKNFPQDVKDIIKTELKNR